MIVTFLAILLASATADQFAEKAKVRSGLPTQTRVIYTHLSLMLKNNKMKAVRSIDPTGVIVMTGGNSPAPGELPATPAAVFGMYKFVADGGDKLSVETTCEELGIGRVRCLFSKASNGRVRSVPVTYINDGLAISRIVVEAPILERARG